MKLLIDANIILDVLHQREPHCKDSSLIWKMCETNKATGYVSSLTFANIVYVMKKELSPKRIEEVLNALSLIFIFVDLTMVDLKNAVASQMKDYEDAIQVNTAERVGAEYIITRNVKDFLGSKIPAYTPTEFLSRV